MKQWLEDFLTCGIQWNAMAFGYTWHAALWPDCPPCTGRWFGCMHFNYGFETIVPLYKSWSLQIHIEKEPNDLAS